MKIHHIDEGVGRIVKGVNTTPDVGMDQTRIEAAKFGNTVDKDGFPPTLSKKVKGKSTNVLFNLGLAEGYKLQLERDKQMLVLNITNTKTGKRTEVRGKPGYETGNYDPNDDLHQLLDTIGKSADISQLMNGEPVGINPKHPDGTKAKAATDKAYSEARYTAYEWACIEGGHDLNDLKESNSKPRKSSDLFAQLENFADEMTPRQKDMLQKQLSYTEKMWNKDTLEKYNKTLDQFDEIRKKLDGKVVKIDGEEAELEFEMDAAGFIGVFDEYSGEEVNPFTLKFMKTNENFADGKKKGKSRPGRVKKSGASCNGSVTALRKRAKNASGEKAKMYHWCANMKSGRKKK
jgi:hypothetical protein